MVLRIRRPAVGGVVTEVIQDLGRSWRHLALTDIVCKFVSFAVLTPATMLLLRSVISGAEGRVIADVDIATFFLTRPIGVLTLVLGGALFVGITALEMACLMAIGITEAKGGAMTARGALAFGAAHGLPVLRLTANMVVRLLAGLLLFLLAAGIAYWALLRDYDINFYLAVRPPAFWVAVAIAGVLLAVLAVLFVRTIARWALALPLVLFEDVTPGRALGESSKRSAGARGIVVAVLASWAAFAVVLLAAVGVVPEIIGRNAAPQLAGSQAALLLFITALALLWVALGLVAAMVNASLFALAIVRLYLGIGNPKPHLPEPAAPGRRARIPRSVLVGAAAVVILAASGIALLVAASTRRNQPVLVIAHRGSSATAPENTLAAFRLAVEQDADFIEFDVQESADGEVVVMHDSDLMRMGGSPLKVWEADASALRSVDIGSRTAPTFSSERVPTLAETLAASKGGTRVIVELKSYGHAQRLEERVVAIVEAAGMANDSIFMSLDHDMVRKVKQLRPSWRAGVLVAKAIGDLTSLKADFLAVEARLATRAFVRQAHRAGQDVYVWTLNDPAWMLAAMSNGVDGLITDKPDVARRVVERRAGMTDAQRIVVALLIRLGARTEALAAEDALRP
jgi:glycerophosphoryl diester phosphodiesterase